MPRNTRTDPPPAQGDTLQRREENPEPRLPHEHDESADSQDGVPTEVGQQAKEDLDRGLTDTDRGPVLDEDYRRQRSQRR